MSDDKEEIQPQIRLAMFQVTAAITMAVLQSGVVSLKNQGDVERIIAGRVAALFSGEHLAVKKALAEGHMTVADYMNSVCREIIMKIEALDRENLTQEKTQ